ncbi:MAG TPA: Hsp33 family molecular chaperone HslO [Pseudomonadales bacterium]|nr:Hsp33 family molecular chaperone HslO [Pseudomonadales bacterium]
MTEESKSDQVVRFLFEECAVRGVWVNLQKSCGDVLAKKGIGPAGRVLLGESLAAAVLLGSSIKLQGRVAIQARGDGVLKLLVAESTQDAGIRGVINLDASVDLQAIPSLKQLIGSGYLAVTLLPDEGESYQGIVPLQGVRLQDCLADYFALSEQLSTALWLVSDGERAAGLMLQAMPGEDNDGEDWRHLHTLASTLTSEELLSLPCEVLLHRLFHQETVRVFDAEPVRFQCTCSEERSRNALAILGRDELHKLFSEQPDVDIDCHFCGAKYRYTANDMADIFGDISSSLH